MNPKILLLTSLKSLAQHKVRSLLTTLGIIIGVVSIICVMSIGQGAKENVNKAIQKLGSNFIIVLSASQKKLAQRGAPPRPILTPQDLRAIRNEIDDVSLVSPALQFSGKITHNGSSWEPIVAGTDDKYFTIREWKTISGTQFTEHDVHSSNKVAVIGQTVAKEVFKDENPIGKKIRIKRIPFKIIGILDEMGKRPDGVDQDDVVFIPISTMLKRLIGGKEIYFAFMMSAKNKDVMHTASEQVRALLRQNHRIPENQDDDFTIFNQDDISEASDTASRILNLLLFFVASISLIVGGIGIMNIMLVTVTERTREIGIRMALGATTSNILNQFILEAITICLLGGSLGALVGISVSKLIGMGLGWPIVISKTSLIIALGSSALIGLFFGYYPAYKASQLNPVEALIER